MPDIDFGQLSEALNDKSDRDFQNIDFVNGADAVVAYQMPSAANNYTWYRKYKSGWVEQGGISSGGKSVAVTLPVVMIDGNYTVVFGNTSSGYEQIQIIDRTTTSFSYHNTKGTTPASCCWQVSGLSASL